MNKKLIEYFSYNNHTKMIAEKIKETLNCDIVQLQPVIPYSKNYQQDK